MNKKDNLKNLDDFNLRGADSVCHDCNPEKCNDADCDVYLDFWGAQVQPQEKVIKFDTSKIKDEFVELFNLAEDEANNPMKLVQSRLKRPYTTTSTKDFPSGKEIMENLKEAYSLINKNIEHDPYENKSDLRFVQEFGVEVRPLSVPLCYATGEWESDKLKQQLKAAKGKAKRKIRRQLKKFSPKRVQTNANKRKP